MNSFELVQYRRDKSSLQLPPKGWRIEVTWACARSSTSRGVKEQPSFHNNDRKPPESKKIDCPFKLKGYIDKNNPDSVIFVPEFGHNHIPDSPESQRWLKLDAATTAKIEEVRWY